MSVCSELSFVVGLMAFWALLLIAWALFER